MSTSGPKLRTPRAIQTKIWGCDVPLRTISIAVLALLVLSTGSACADCLDRVAEFAVKICGEIENSGRQVTVDASGQLNAQVQGIVRRIVGAGAEIKGSVLIETYEGVLRKDLVGEKFNARDCRQKMVSVAQAEACKRPVSYKTCRHPDFGREGWRNSQDFSGSSGWRSGGFSQADWCRQLGNNVISSQSIGPDHSTSTVTSSEQGRWTGLRQRQYNYHCTVRVRWGTVYNERTDPRCGVMATN